MTKHSGDPVETIAEADATGEIAELYGEIRAGLGVPVVNLIWRHLAVIPGGLPWAWHTVKPLYASGAIAGEAAQLRGGIVFAAGTALSPDTTAAAGLSHDDMSRITMVLDSYERSNAMNLLSLSALMARLDDRQQASESSSAPLDSGRPVGGQMPELLALQDMQPTTRNLVEALNQCGERTAIMPSMYRHLAHWPPFLALLHAYLATLHADGRLEEIMQQTLRESAAKAEQLAGGLATPKVDLSPESQARVRKALEVFIDGPLVKMVAIVACIRAAMGKV